MSEWLQLIVGTLAIALVAATYFILANGRRKPKVLPPPRSKSTVRSYAETNSIAKLFLETVALKESGARWPAVLKGLNEDDNPHIRTLLLELRSLNNTDPREALEAIEEVCIEFKRTGDASTRWDLLDHAQSRLRAQKS